MAQDEWPLLFQFESISINFNDTRVVSHENLSLMNGNGKEYRTVGNFSVLSNYSR